MSMALTLLFLIVVVPIVYAKHTAGLHGVLALLLMVAIMLFPMVFPWDIAVVIYGIYAAVFVGFGLWCTFNHDWRRKSIAKDLARLEELNPLPKLQNIQEWRNKFNKTEVQCDENADHAGTAAKLNGSQSDSSEGNT